MAKYFSIGILWNWMENWSRRHLTFKKCNIFHKGGSLVLHVQFACLWLKVTKTMEEIRITLNVLGEDWRHWIALDEEEIEGLNWFSFRKTDKHDFLGSRGCG